MTADVNENNVSPEVVPQATEASHQVPDPKPVEAPQKENFKRLRMKAEQLERELSVQKELNTRILAMQPAQAQTKEVDELDAIGGEEYINKSKIDRLVEKKATKIAEEIARRESERMIQEQRNATFLDRLKRQYSDFDDVVNPETLALLEEKNPELAGTIADLKDPYKIGLQTYNYIKAMNIASQAPDARRAKEVEKKLEENSKTIVSPQVYDKRPMAQAFRMSEQEKHALYKEMMQFANQSAGY